VHGHDAAVDPELDDQPIVGRRRDRAPVAVAVAVGGALGAAARYEVGLAMVAPPGAFPLAIFAVNLSGSFLLGVVATTLVGRHGRSGTLGRRFAVSGFLGAYTTWSTYLVEVEQLARKGHTGVAAAYLVGSVAGGLALAAAGAVATRGALTAVGARGRHRAERPC